MKKIALNKEEQEELTPLITRYFAEELDIELGNLQAQLLLDFLSEKVGVPFYNAGVNDAIAKFRECMDSVEEEVDLLRVIQS